jgi:nucleotide-binding universal stress UspA family protein
MKILLAIDESRFSEAATKVLLRQVRTENTEICVLHVAKPLLLIPYAYIGQVGDLGQAEEEELERGKELVAHAQQLLASAGFKAHALVEKGDPRAVIVDHAARWNADLIVLGSHGFKGLDRLLIGSVSEAVLRHAPCSVEIVRIPLAGVT